MHVKAPTLDDLLRTVFEKLLKRKSWITATRGSFVEELGAMLVLTNPRARLSRTERRAVLYSCLGELLWYLAKSDRLAFIKYYIAKYRDESEDGRTIYGAYGPRIFGNPGPRQLENVVSILRASPKSRRAVIQLFDAKDIAGRERRKEIPCTCTLQFIRRGNRLHMMTAMRSNDAFKGLPHDVFTFTMLQEIVARELGVEPGGYRHFVGSLHLYRDDAAKAEQLVDEGWQKTSQGMPPMPRGDPWPGIKKVLRAERTLRHGKDVDENALDLDPYWSDIVRLLRIYAADTNAKKIASIRRSMSTRVYDRYIDVRKRRAERETAGPAQPIQVKLL